MREGENMTEKTKKSSQSIWLKIINIPEITAIVPLVILIVVASIMNPAFLRIKNLQTLCSGTVGSWGLFAIGQAFIIIAGEINLALGAEMAFSGVLFSYCLLNGWSLLPAILVCFAVTFTCELINSFVVLKLNVPVFIATLGMQFICKGMAKVVNYGAVVTMYNTNDLTRNFCDTLSKKPLGLGISFWVFLLFAIAASIVLTKTAFGRKLLAVGDNKVVAKASGIDVPKVKFFCFMFCALLVGICAILWSGNNMGCNVTHGIGWEFISVAACALGGVSLVGGRGTILGVFIGIMTMAVIYNVIVLLSINVNFQNIFIGLFLAFAVIFDVIRREKTLGKNI